MRGIKNQRWPLQRKKGKCGVKVQLNDTGRLKHGSTSYAAPTCMPVRNVEDLLWVSLDVHSMETHAGTGKLSSGHTKTRGGQPRPGIGQPPFTRHDRAPPPWRVESEGRLLAYSESSVLLFQGHVSPLLSLNPLLRGRTYTQDPHWSFAHSLSPQTQDLFSSLCQTKVGHYLLSSPTGAGRLGGSVS